MPVTSTDHSGNRKPRGHCYSLLRAVRARLSELRGVGSMLQAEHNRP